MDDLGAPILGNHQISTDPQQISTVSMQVPWNPATQELLGLLQTWRWQKNPGAFLVVTASYVPNNWLRSIYNPGMAPNILIIHDGSMVPYMVLHGSHQEKPQSC